MNNEKLHKLLKEQDENLVELEKDSRYYRERSNNLLKSIYLSISLIEDYAKENDEPDDATHKLLDEILFIYQTALSDNSIDQICDVEDYIDGFIFSKLHMNDEPLEMDDIEVNVIHEGDMNIPDVLEDFLRELKKQTDNQSKE